MNTETITSNILGLGAGAEITIDNLYFKKNFLYKKNFEDKNVLYREIY